MPLTGAPTTELRGVHVAVQLAGLLPDAARATVNHFDVLGGGADEALVTPAQHRAANIAAGESVLRLFSGLNLRLFYSGYLGTAALSAAPDITSVEALDTGADVEFAVRVAGNPAAGIQQVWVTYTGDGPSVGALDLTQDPADSTLWKRTLPLASPAGLRFVVQAVNGLGLVTLDDAARLVPPRHERVHGTAEGDDARPPVATDVRCLRGLDDRLGQAHGERDSPSRARACSCSSGAPPSST